MTTTDEAAALAVLHAAVLAENHDTNLVFPISITVKQNALFHALLTRYTNGVIDSHNAVALTTERVRLLASQERAIADALAEAQAEISRLRALIIRAQISGDKLPQSWHNDARAALGDAS